MPTFAPIAACGVMCLLMVSTLCYLHAISMRYGRDGFISVQAARGRPLVQTKSLVGEPPSGLAASRVHVRLFLDGGLDFCRTVCEVNRQQVPFDTLRNDPEGEAIKAYLACFMKIGGRKPVTIDAEFQVPERDVVCVVNAALAAGYRDIQFTVPDAFRKPGDAAGP
ncbi:MAG: hypothetical protein AAB215_09535 [Planctomycetota bacterium]